MYFVLAAFDLLAVVLSLVLLHQVIGLQRESVDLNTTWTMRLSDVSDLMGIAGDANAHGNDLFRVAPADQDAAIADARAALDRDAARFEDGLDQLRTQLAAVVEPTDLEGFDAAIDATVGAMAELRSQADRVFDEFSFDRGKAGQHMARMDAGLRDVTDQLATLGTLIHDCQGRDLAEQARAAAQWGRFEIIIGGMILTMVGAVVVYGSRLARRFRESHDELEHVIAARTAELERSHQRLRASERLASIGTLAAGLGHDMSNLLFPVQCRLDAIAHADDLDGARDNLGAIQQSVRYLQQLSRGLRLLADTPDGSETGEDGSCRLRDWRPEVEALFAAVVRAPIRLEWDLGDDELIVGVPAHHLTQIVFNLVGNAEDAVRDQADGVIRISAASLDNDDAIVLRVIDNGHGMTPSVRDHALDPFYTTKGRGLSTGLGLAIVHGLVQSAGGGLDITSAPDEGTTVEVRLPVPPVTLPSSPGVPA